MLCFVSVVWDKGECYAICFTEIWCHIGSAKACAKSDILVLMTWKMHCLLGVSIEIMSYKFLWVFVSFSCDSRFFYSTFWNLDPQIFEEDILEDEISLRLSIRFPDIMSWPHLWNVDDWVNCVYPSEHPFLQLCGSAVIPVCLTEFLMGIKVIIKDSAVRVFGKRALYAVVILQWRSVQC